LLDATARLFANEARHEAVYDCATTPIYAAYVADPHGDYGTPPALQPPLDVPKQSQQILLNLPPHTFILPAAFLMLAVVVPAASASRVKRPSLFNDASQRTAAAHTHGFLPGRSSFLFKMSNAVSTTDAGLYAVLNGGHLSTPTEGPQETSYKPRPPACGDA
jgi:hypothetical protein